MIDEIKSAILANIGPLKQAPKGWQKCCCKICNTRGHGKDTRNRFGVNITATSVAVHCFNCGFSSGYTLGKSLSKSFKFFLSQIGIPSKFIEQLEFEIFKQQNSISILRDGEIRITPAEKLKTLFSKWHKTELPSGAMSIAEWADNNVTDSNFSAVVDYMVSRKIFDFDNFYWTPHTEFNLHQRLIIPYKYNNKIVGFTSRLCYDLPDKSIPKYYQQCPEDFVYNFDHQTEWARKFVIVTEGVLDAWTVDGVSVLGEVNQSQADVINQLQKTVIVCPDRDKKGWDLVQIAIDNNWQVAFPKWHISIKDAADSAIMYGKLLTIHSILSSAVSGKDKIALKWKIDQLERNRHAKQSYKRAIK